MYTTVYENINNRLVMANKCTSIKAVETICAANKAIKL